MTTTFLLKFSNAGIERVAARDIVAATTAGLAIATRASAKTRTTVRLVAVSEAI